MPGIFAPIGLPGPGTVVAAAHKHVFKGLWDQMLPGGKVIDGTVARDATNVGYPSTLQPGLLMGKVSATGWYANSVIGLSTLALTSTGTTLTVGAATATEISRRIGASGTISLVGPAAASGVVRSIAVPYTSVNTTAGTVAMTAAAGVNEVQTLDFANSPSGTFELNIVDSNGVLQKTARITYSGTIATLLANLQTATDLVLATNAIVWTGTVVTAVAGTFSGTGYAGLPQALIVADDDAFTAGSISVARTTAGVGGAFVTGSFIMPADGSQTILTFIPDGYGIRIADDAGTYYQVPFPEIPIAGMIEHGQIINYPTDPSLQAWLKAQLLLAGGRFTWDDNF
jgi:hypothetical protein